MKEDVLFDPLDAGFFSSDAVVSESDRVADLVEEFGHCRTSLWNARKQESALNVCKGYT